MYRGLTDRLFGVPGLWNLRRCSDERCGTYWLDPKPVDEDLVKLYRRYYTHEERSEQHGAGALRRRWERPSSRVVEFILRMNPVWSANLDFSAFYLPAKAQGRLLEIGCGAGAMLETMASRGWEAVGVDFDENAVAIARSRGRSVYPGGVFEQNFPDESFDAIVMNHVIEHVSAPRELLAECRRVLRKGGALVIITPNPGGFLHRFFGKDWRGLEPPRHLHLFSLAALSQLASAAGFSGVQTRTTVHGTPHFWFASSQLRRHGASAMHMRPTMAHRILAHTVAFGLGLLNAIFANRGEESVLICTRPEHGD
jgi:2-polyprenyl-3-methyl-5-hydroxy-6-metoxy-1,4-benzoquinol methylase